MKKIPRGLAVALSAALILGLVPALSASAADPVLPVATDALSLPAAAADPEQRAAAPMAIEDDTRASDRRYALPLNPDTYRLTSPQGPRCIPVIGGSTHHLGQDLGTKNAAPIYAVTDGVVRFTKNGTSSASGQIIVKHEIDGQTFETAYLHMWNATTHVKVGQKVKAGQKIGLVGSSGPSTGPHLHLEVWKERFYSKDSNVVAPSAWLNSKGISLAKYATEIYPQTPPASCTYYARGKIDIFATDSSSSKVLARVPRNAAVTSKPGSINGMINGDFVKITYGKVTGWANRYSVTPNRLADAAEGSLTSSGVATNGMLLPFGKYRLTGTANFRTGPSTWYSSMGQVSQGKSVEALESRDGWLRVSYQGKTGWISATLLARTAVLDPTEAKATHQTAYATKLRSGAGDGHPEIRELPKATKAAIRRIQGSWTQLQIGTKTGWVPSASIHQIGTAAPKPPAPAPAPKATHTTTNNLNLREGPATSTKILRELSEGTKVTVLSAQDTWRRVQVDSDKGWVAGAYLKAVQAAPKPPVVSPKPPVAKPKPPVAKPKPPASTHATTKSLKLKKSASVKSTSIRSLTKGTKLAVLKTQGSWRYVQVGSHRGWVPSSGLKSLKPAAPKTTKVTKKTYSLKARTTARKGPGSNYGVVRTLPKGHKVTVNARNGSWLRFTVSGKNAWAHSSQLAVVKPAAYKTKKTTSNVNLRSGASASYKRLLTVPQGKRVKVLATKSGWTKTTYGKKTGWLSSRYLK